MRCPYCKKDSDKVIDSRAANEGEVIRRRRECTACDKRFTTYERVEEIPMFVVITKIDLAPPEIYNQTVANLSKILKGSFCNLKPIVVKDEKNLD